VISTRTAFAVLAVIAAAPAHAAVVISTSPTQNMSCSGGVCQPTATDAVLNVTDLENDLSQFGNVTVMTTGNGVEANNIVVRAAFSSPDSTSLTLDAHKVITINALVSIGSGTAELELQTDGQLAALSFGRGERKKGHITFGSLSDIFGINGGIFTLVGSVQGLAKAVAADPSGAYALANSYDASQDGTYRASPVGIGFSGAFEGLGNRIENLSINDKSDVNVGLFSVIAVGGTVSHISVTNEFVQADFANIGGIAGSNDGTILQSRAGTDVGGTGNIGGVVGENYGDVVGSYAMGNVQDAGVGDTGGLVGYNDGSIETSSAVCTVSGGSTSFVGGLAGANDGSIDQSFATGKVSGDAATSLGGLAGASGSVIRNSYATGPVSANFSDYAGGFIGENAGVASKSYSAGFAVGGVVTGGFIAFQQSGGGLKWDYWNTTTSGTSVGVGDGPSKGVRGLTSQQLQSGLPTSFDPKIWAENPGINNGFPYLIHNPPPK
jgi:hypothetical protein